jgi:hypothetical protein
MASEPFRFLHASQLRLDEPLAGSGPLDSETRIVAEDATLTALESIVDACLAEGVEFLLLTGETFGSGPPTLRARRALLRAFENLCEFEIQVFWEVDREELACVEVPDNVTPIHPGDREPVAVVRQGRVIASVVAAECVEPQLSADDVDLEERGAFRVGMAGKIVDADRFVPHNPPADAHAFEPVPSNRASSYDYLALGTTGQRTTRRSAAAIAHDPGPAQGVGVNETGNHGATLVRVDADRAAELTFVPTAPVRWERILVGVERHLTCEQLAERMQSALLELEPAAVERLWIVNWQMIGSGNLFHKLKSGAAIEELTEAVNLRMVTGNDIRRLDRFQFRRRHALHTDELCEQIAGWIRGSESDPVADVLAELHNLSGPAWVEVVRESLPLIDPARARDDAARLSQELLSQSRNGQEGAER